MRFRIGTTVAQEASARFVFDNPRYQLRLDVRERRKWNGAFGWRAPDRSTASRSRILSEIDFEHADGVIRRALMSGEYTRRTIATRRRSKGLQLVLSYARPGNHFALRYSLTREGHLK
jgi:hypothetical protein